MQRPNEIDRRVRAPETARFPRGVTTLELVVVLVILVGLAGLLVPLLAGMNRRAYGSSGAAGMNEAAKAVQMFHAQNGRHPQYYDSLFDDDGVAQWVIEQAIDEPAPWLLPPKPVDKRTGDALNAIGISETCILNDEADPPYPTEFTTMTLRGGDDPVGWVVWLSYEGIETLGLTPISDTAEPIPGIPFHYVVFGLGQRCEAVGKTMATAPVHYSTESLLGPLERYAHLLLVYEIPGAGPARLAAVAALDGQEITGSQTHLNAYYAP